MTNSTGVGTPWTNDEHEASRIEKIGMEKEAVITVKLSAARINFMSLPSAWLCRRWEMRE